MINVTFIIICQANVDGLAVFPFTSNALAGSNEKDMFFFANPACMCAYKVLVVHVKLMQAVVSS